LSHTFSSHAPARPLALTSRERRTSRAPRAAALALPALCLGLLGPLPAEAAPAADSPYLGQNTPAGATVLTPSGGSHPLGYQLRTAAADGTVQVVSARVTPTRVVPVAVLGATRTARILGGAAAESGTQLYAGGGAVVLRQGSSFSLLDVATGTTTTLAGLPSAGAGLTRTVTAVAATAEGALVATADVTEPGTSGHIAAAHVWLLEPASATSLAELVGVHLPALAAGTGGVDALVVDAATDDLSLLHIDGSGNTSTLPVAVDLPNDVIAAEVGYAADGTTPVVSLTTASGVTVAELDGDVVRAFPAGSRVFLSAADLTDPTTVSNPLAKSVRLSGIGRNGSVVRFGTRVRPAATATATGAVAAGPAPATLSLRQGSSKRVLRSGASVTLTRDSCFTAASPATLFTSAAAPVTRCVEVQHKLALKSYSRRGRVAVVSTTASTVRVEVFKHGRWVLQATAKASRSGNVRFRAPAGTVRVVAAADDAHAAAVLLVTKR
jgi:hypothetical protein